MNGLTWLDQTEPLQEDTPRQNADERPQPDEEGSDNVSRQHHENPSHPNGSGIDPNEYEINPDAIANEGFFDSIASLFKSKPKTVELNADNDSMEDALRESILSDTWLKEQTFGTGTVSFKGTALLNSGDAKKAVAQILQGLDKASASNAQLAVKWMKPLEKKIAICQKGNFTDYTADQLQEWTPEIENLDYSMKFAEPTELGQDKVDLQLPVLDQAGVKEIAQLLLQLYKGRQTYPDKSIGTAKIKFAYNGGKIFDIKDPELKAAAKEFVNTLESAIDHYGENFFQDQFNYFGNVVGLSNTLLQWISKSITGVKLTAANEAFMTISNEGIVEGIRQFFGLHNRGGDYVELEGKTGQALQNLTTQLARTYGNTDWLSKQSPVKGTVKADDLSKSVDLSNIQGSLDAAASINMQINNAYTEAVRKVYTSLKPGLDLVGSACNLTDEAFETLKQLVAETKPVSELYKGPASVKPLGSEATDKVEALSTDKMPELTKAAIKHLNEIGNRQLDHLESISSVSKAFDGDFLQLISEMTFLEAVSSDKGFELRNNKSKYNQDAWVALGCSIHRKVSPVSIPAVKATNDQLNAALSAAVAYMERSLAGSSVSNEDFTVANEGIVDTILDFFRGKGKGDGKKGAPKAPSLKPLEQFELLLKDNTLSFPGGTINSTAARALAINGKIPADLTKAIMDDVKQYMQVYSQAKQTITKFAAHYKKYEPKLDTFCGDADRPEEFEQAVKAWVSTQPKPLVDSFKAPSHTFMGYGQDTWVKDRAFVTAPPTNPVSGELTLPAMNASQVNKLKAALNVLLTQYDKVQDYEYDDAPLSIDFTDAPFRGYSGIDSIDTLLNTAEMGMGYFEERNTDVLSAICNRMYDIFAAVVPLLAGNTK